MSLTIDHRPARTGILRRLLWASCSAVALPVLLIGAEALASPSVTAEVPTAATIGTTSQQTASTTGASTAGTSGTGTTAAGVPASGTSGTGTTAGGVSGVGTTAGGVSGVGTTAGGVAGAGTSGTGASAAGTSGTGTSAGGATGTGTTAGVSATGASAAGVPATVAPSQASIGVLSHSSNLSAHSCSAAVVASTSGEVIVTAAHCVNGTGRGMVFAPGYRSGTAPHGTWVVTGAYAAADWLTGQNPQNDVVFLTVRPTTSSQGTVQSAVGGYPLGSAPPAASQARVTGYVKGVDTPTSCTTTIYWTRGYPSFDCDGFAGGTSGGPWISSARTGTPTLTAVIGGLHQGGCSPDTSYSSVFNAATASVLARATQNRPADTLPSPDSDGC